MRGDDGVQFSLDPANTPVSRRALISALDHRLPADQEESPPPLSRLVRKTLDEFQRHGNQWAAPAAAAKDSSARRIATARDSHAIFSLP